MARYRGTVQGGRGEASRLGNAKDGLMTTTYGWDLGAICTMDPDPNDSERDKLEISITNGSGTGCETFGRLDVRRSELGVSIVPDYVLLRHTEMTHLTALLGKLAANHPDVFEMLARMLVLDENAARVLRGLLFTTGTYYETPTP